MENANSWTMAVERGPDCLLVRFSGRIAVPPGEPPLAELLWSLMQKHFTRRIMLDFGGVEVLTGYALRQLAVLGGRIDRNDGMIRICGLSEYDRRLLRRHDWNHRLPAYAYRNRMQALFGQENPRLPPTPDDADASRVQWQ